jgi:hypothetical protein
MKLRNSGEDQGAGTSPERGSVVGDGTTFADRNHLPIELGIDRCFWSDAEGG